MTSPVPTSPPLSNGKGGVISVFSFYLLGVSSNLSPKLLSKFSNTDFLVKKGMKEKKNKSYVYTYTHAHIYTHTHIYTHIHLKKTKIEKYIYIKSSCSFLFIASKIFNFKIKNRINSLKVTKITQSFCLPFTQLPPRLTFYITMVKLPKLRK